MHWEINETLFNIIDRGILLHTNVWTVNCYAWNVGFYLVLVHEAI